MDTLQALRGLLDATRLIGSGEDLTSLLNSLARIVGDSLGFRAVVVNLYRPAFDDLHVAAVHGNEESRRMLLGKSYEVAQFAPLLDERFDRGGAYFIPADGLDWSTLDLDMYVPEGESGDDPDAWDPEDSLMVPMRSAEGDLLGILSIDEPLSGRRPTQAELDVMVVFARNAAATIEHAQRSLADARHNKRLEELLRVSSAIPGSATIQEVLDQVAAGISEALGFQKVIVALADDSGRAFHPQAAYGWEGSEAVLRSSYGCDVVARLLDPAFTIEGCQLLPQEEGRRRVGNPPDYSTTVNGRGPHAWNHHYLLVPLSGPNREVEGLIWVDEPEDLLLPSRARLQALRMFANLASTALLSATKAEELRRSEARLAYEATHDPLTGLANRALFLSRLDEVLADRRLPGAALLFVDIDGFKDVNDSLGHAAGDRVLLAVSNALTAGSRADDLTARIGGDEFVVLLPGCNQAEACRTAARICDAVQGPVSVGEGGYVVRASVGVAVAERGWSMTGDELLAAADGAMYAAKHRGGGCWSLADSEVASS